MIGPETHDEFLHKPIDLGTELQPFVAPHGAREDFAGRTMTNLARDGLLPSYHEEEGTRSAVTTRAHLLANMAQWQEDPLRKPRNMGPRTILLLAAFCGDEIALTTLRNEEAEKQEEARQQALEARRRMLLDSLTTTSGRVVETVTASSMQIFSKVELGEKSAPRFQGVVGAVARQLRPTPPAMQRSAGNLLTPEGVICIDRYEAPGKMRRQVAILGTHFEQGYQRVEQSGVKIPGISPRAQEITNQYIEALREVL